MARNFDLIAPIYDRLAGLIFGQAIKKSQLAFLEQIPKGSSVLILGGGTGWMLEALLKRAQPAHIVYLEPSKEMLRLTKNRLEQASFFFESTIEFRQGDIHQVKPGESFEVLITFFVLDLFSQPELNKIHDLLDHHLLPGGLWLFADFDRPKGLARFPAALLFGIMYSFFHFATGISGNRLLDFPSLFKEKSYQKKKEAGFYFQMITARLYQKQGL